MNPCVFCRIIAKELPSKVVDEGEDWIAIHDINPQAPTHVLIIPKEHIANLNQTASRPELLGKLLAVAVKLAKVLELTNGYRIVVNTGMEGGQSVDHLHFHLLGGRFMGWPPG